MGDRDALDELRLIFRGEVEDHVATLERESGLLATGAAQGDAGGSVREIYRAVHSLKGAARAVDFSLIERVCHQLETQLAAAPDPALVSSLAFALAGALREWVERGSEQALSQLGSASGNLAEPPRPPAPRAPEPRAAPPSSPTGAAPSTSPPSAGASEGPIAPRETARVSIAKLGALAEASEELLGLSSRSTYDARPVEDTLGALKHDLSRLQAAARRAGAPDAAAAAERALSTAQTLRLLLASERERADRWRRSMALGAREVADGARALRVVPLATLAGAIRRAAHELGLDLNKRVELTLELEGAEVDRSVRDGLNEVLLHLVRNAIDHGIERPAEREAAGKPAAGQVRVGARLFGRELRVVVEDDGRGLDRDELLAAAQRLGHQTEGLGSGEVLGLVFEPGLTTASVATAVSGRGMGLEIARQRVGQLHGRIGVEPRSPSGTRFSLALPIDLSVLRGLVVRTGETLAVLPTTAVVRLRRVRTSLIRSIEGRAHVDELGATLPLVQLGALLRRERSAGVSRPGDVVWYAVIGAGERAVALEVDAFLDERELVVRRPSARLRRVPFVSGLTVLDAEDVAVVLDVQDLVSMGQARTVLPPADPGKNVRVLVVDDSITTRQLVRSILDAAGYEVQVAADGEQAWNVLTESSVDLVVSDVDMPRMDGFQLLSRVRSERRLAKVPVVLVTALEQEADRQRAFDLGASAYIVKAGFDQDELLSTIEELL